MFYAADRYVLLFRDFASIFQMQRCPAVVLACDLLSHTSQIPMLLFLRLRRRGQEGVAALLADRRPLWLGALTGAMHILWAPALLGCTLDPCVLYAVPQRRRSVIYRAWCLLFLAHLLATRLPA
eukprot:NODE_5711_length_560_cov_291.568317.p2 GENE.NODE_5711_length_560_cov_291.568317~~NODE_5711_length_560_cov_291.568317.p2  ORF type:complete len:143 (-),score=26.57 NODE_5711_length_560_cov_291.568317:96-467(-)